ncbi:HTH-type transcriptional regulator MalT [Burkholderiales bacterium]|nr:HTH-type transcriptional regulator MalT [Burkholderiales bacterium]
MPTAPTLAKFSRPRLYAVVKRERLFRALDEARAHPIVFIAGPPGAGKSTLVASWLEARRIPGLWFQADIGDSDPATFFHYLALAAGTLGARGARKAATLPRWNPGYAAELVAFTRRFLREFFALFPAGSVFAVDNFHEAAGAPEWRQAFADGLAELPAGLNIVFLSRAGPPPEMSRLLATQAMVQLGWESLRFTADETAAVVGRVGETPAIVDAIHRASDGWAAGLVLMREHLARLSVADAGALRDSAALDDSREAVFAYFTGEIFARARPENRRTLMLAALLPSVTADDAEALSGNPEAQRLFEHLYRRHLFVDRRRAGERPVYHFHALFREFLLAEGRARLPADERREALARAAAMLLDRGDVDAAASIYRNAGAWRELAELARSESTRLIGEGRHETLRGWIDSLPPGMRDAEPELVYALAVTRVHGEPARAKELLARAYHAFHAAGDTRHAMLAAAASIDCHYHEWADFAPLDRWIDVLERGLHGPRVLRSPAEELRVRASLLLALLFRQPTRPELVTYAEAVAALLTSREIADAPVNMRMSAASVLFNYYNWTTKGESADALIALALPWLDDPQATPLNRVWFLVHLAFHEQIMRQYAKARRRMAEAEAIAREHGLAGVLFEIYHADVSAASAARDVAGTQAALERLRSVLNPARRMDVAYFRHQEAAYLLLAGRAREAADASREAVEIGREVGLPSMQLPHLMMLGAHALLADGRRDESIARYEQAIALAAPVDKRSFTFHRDFARAHFTLAAGNETGAVAILANLFAACREAKFFGFMRQPAEDVARLVALALAHGVEADYARTLVRLRKLPAPSPDLADWPWPIAIRTFGAFELTRHGEPVVSRGKAQKKPLELLKALVAFGARRVDAAMLTALLWPEAEGDDAKASFDSTLYRLRKLLDVEGALPLSEGKLSLDAASVWVDALALEALLDAEPVAVERALALARGDFLADESALPWAARARDRLKSRLLRAVLSEAERREARGDHAGARALYEAALERDNLAESVYRRLMVCQRELGDSAGALLTYRRCRELLSIVLGRTPAAETEAIRQSLAVA